MVFLQQVRAAYPNLTNGEDPVFIAALLSEAERVSTVSATTYLQRFPEVRRRTKLMHAIDFVRHAAMVRQMYLDSAPQYWREGYRPFLLRKVEQFFLKPDLMSEVEQHVIRIAMLRAGIGKYLAPSNIQKAVQGTGLRGQIGEVTNSIISAEVEATERDANTPRGSAESDVSRETAALRAELEAVYTSTSWLITKPLRSISALRRRISCGIRHAFTQFLSFMRVRRDKRLVASSALFDRTYYLEHYWDVESANIDPVLHYLSVGAYEGRDPGPRFGSRWYLEQYPDVSRAGLNPLVHYLRHGQFEERQARSVIEGGGACETG
jgi:hypothetical protein